MSLLQAYEELDHLLTKESRRRRSFFKKDMWRSNAQQNIIERIVKYLENLDDDYFAVTYVDRENKKLLYHVKNSKTDKRNTVEFTVPFSGLYSRFKEDFLDNFYKWFNHDASSIGKSKEIVEQHLNKYLNTIKENNVRDFFCYELVVEECSQRKKAYYNRMKKIKECHSFLIQEWKKENPNRTWVTSETCKGLYKKFDMNFIFEQILMFVK